jgi:hypothetical protein
MYKFKLISEGREEFFVPSMADDGTYVCHTYRADGQNEYPSGGYTEDQILSLGGVPCED